MDRAKVISVLQQVKALVEECLQAVGEQPQPQSREKKPVQAKSHGLLQIDFDKPLRPFVKSYAKKLSGPKKFVLLLSWLTKGDLKKEVALNEVQRHWNRMTSLLEMKFNRFFPAQAKNNDWVDSKKKGFYNLRPNWKDVLKKTNG